MASYKISSRLFYSLTAGRLVVLIIILISSFLLNDIGEGWQARDVEKFFLLLAFAFFVTIIAILWFKRKRLSLPFIYSYIITDLLLVTGAVYLTGGTKSHLSFLYMLVILSSCFFEYRQGPSVSAGIATLSYIFLTIIDAQKGASSRNLAFVFFTNMAAFWLTALLGSILAKRLLISRKEVDRLKAIQETLLESLSSGLILTDPSGEVIFINKAGLEILEDAKDITPGLNLKDLWYEIWEMSQEVRENKRAERHEMELSFKDGTKKCLGISCFSITAPGENTLLGYGFIFQDITPFKEQERRLQRADRLAALGEMAAGLAHELRNPLASMSGAAQFLSKKRDMDPESKRLLRIIEKEASRLNSIAESFLLYARPERGGNEEIADPVRVIEDVLALLERKKDLPPATIETRFEAKERLQVPEGPLKQVVLNLIMNAFESLEPEGGRISIHLIKGEKDSESKLVIEDTGTGIDDKLIDMIFNPFYSTKPTGTGLGLAIVHSLVKSWGGDIEVHSRKGRGTRFSITLPRVKDIHQP